MHIFLNRQNISFNLWKTLYHTVCHFSQAKIELPNITQATVILEYHIWASTRENLPLGFANNNMYSGLQTTKAQTSLRIDTD